MRAEGWPIVESGQVVAYVSVVHDSDELVAKEHHRKVLGDLGLEQARDGYFVTWKFGQASWLIATTCTQ